MRKLAALALGAACLLSVAATDCDEGTGPNAELREQLEAARDRWEAQGFDDYDLLLQRDCFCGDDYRGPVFVRVRGGQVVERVYETSDQPVPAEPAPFFPDVDGLFAFLEEALSRDPAQARAEFHPEYGYPVTLWIDFATNIADEEQGYTTLSLAPAE